MAETLERVPEECIQKNLDELIRRVERARAKMSALHSRVAARVDVFERHYAEGASLLRPLLDELGELKDLL